MRHRSRSRNYESNDNYKSRRSPVKYESSRSHKSKVIPSHYSSEGRKHDSDKLKKSSDRSRYDNHRDRDSDSDEKFDKKYDSTYDHACKRSKYYKYNRVESPTKHSRKYDDYTHSYRRRSISSDLSNHSYESKYKKIDDKSDSKKNCYKPSKESKRNKLSRSPSSDRISETKMKTEVIKEKVKDKKLKKKSKKSDKEKEKKKRKRQRHSSDEDTRDNDNKRHTEEKYTTNKSSKHLDDNEDQETNNKGKLKLEPFKVKESSNLKSQITFFNSSNIFTKDEWQKESSDDELHKKSDLNKEVSALKKKKMENFGDMSSKNIKCENYEDSTKDSTKKQKIDDEKELDRERNKRQRRGTSHSKTHETIVKSSKHKDTEEEKSVFKYNHGNTSRKERSHSNNKVGEGLKSLDRKDKIRSKDKISQKASDDKGKIEDIFEDERIELPRTPTDAQYTGLFARLLEEPVSDTEIEDILPPILLDDRMKALLVNDPNVTQEAWDSEDDVLLNKRENIIAPKHRGVLETLTVPWKTLIEEASLNKNKQEINKGLSKFNVPNILESIGISKQFSGETLWTLIQNHCSNTFLNPIAPIHQTVMSHKSRRNSIFSERGLFAGALSARKDLFIRRVLYEPMI